MINFISKNITYLGRIIFFILIFLLLVQIVELLAKYRIDKGSPNIKTFRIKPKIIVIKKVGRRGRSGYYSWTISYSDLSLNTRQKQFRFHEDIISKHVINSYRSIKGREGNFLDRITTDFADSGTIKNKRKKLIKKRILENIPEQLVVYQDQKLFNYNYIEDPLLKFKGQVNNNLREFALIQSSNGGRYLLIIIIVFVVGLMLYINYFL